MTQPILLMHNRAAGDIVCMTACVRDLALTYPDKYKIHVHTSCRTLWDHNPHVTPLNSKHTNSMPRYRLDYGNYIRVANRKPMHFIAAFHADLSHKLKTTVPILAPYGDLHLSDEQKATPPIDGRYWFVVTGGKSDFTCKIWSAARWQQTIDILRQFGLRFVQGGALHRGHTQPPMRGVLSVVNKTNLRDLLWLIYHADGVICHVTCMMHMAAALHRPCVVIAGGREHWWWEYYGNAAEKHFGPYAAEQPVPHRFLHTIGKLPCCKDKACWQNKVSSIEKDKHRQYCKKPVDDGHGQLYPKCMDLIQTEHVVEAVMSYYKDGTLPPIGDPKPIVLPDGRPIVPATLTQTPLTVPAPPTSTPDLFVTPIREDEPVQLPAIQPPPTQAQPLKGNQTQNKVNTDIINHEIIGGRVTICVLLYGNYTALHKQCLNAIINTTDPKHRQIRVGCNSVAMETLEYISDLHDRRQIYKAIVNKTNNKKYPAMRQLFYDQEHPIEDKWVIWFDDDSIANRDPQWLPKLLSKVVASYPNGARLIGAQFHWQLTQTQVQWVRSRPWYRNRPFQTRNGRESPNGNHIQFAAGGFWALATDVIRQQNIPDPEIGQNGGDYMVAEQVWQAGYCHAGWNNKKQFVFTSSVPRRGLEEHHTGTANWQPGGVFKKMHT